MPNSFDWDDVWDEYDARCPAPVAPLPRRPDCGAGEVSATKPRTAGRGFSGLVLLTGLVAMAASWVSVPYATALNLAEAIDRRDSPAIASHVDTVAVQAQLRDALADATGPIQTAEASAFLGAMATEMTAAWGRPGALADVALARGVPRGAVAEGLRRAMPTGLTSFELPVYGTVAPLTLQLGLRSEGMTPRWQVTGIRLAGPTPIAAPPAAPMRFSSLR